MKKIKYGIYDNDLNVVILKDYTSKSEMLRTYFVGLGYKDIPEHYKSLMYNHNVKIVFTM